MNINADYQKTLIELDTYYSDSVSNYIDEPINSYVADLFKNRNVKFIKFHVMSRLCNAISIPLGLISSILDTIIALGATFSAVCSGGKHLPSLQVYRYTMDNVAELLPKTFLSLLRIINPDAKLNTLSEEECLMDSNERTLLCLKKFKLNGLGPLSGAFVLLLNDPSINLIDSDNFLKKHIVYRLLFTATIIPSLVTRVADFAIGIFAGILSISTLGLSSNLNTLAYNSLFVSGVLGEIPRAAIILINPWAFSFTDDLYKLKKTLPR